MTRSLESEVRIGTNIPVCAENSRRPACAAMLPGIMRAEGRFRAALRPMGKRTYDPRARLVSRPLERIDGTNTAATSSARGAPQRAVLLGWFHKIGGPGQAAARAACYSAAARLRSPTHAMLRLSHSTCRTLSDSRARSMSRHRKTALMARSLGLLQRALAQPVRTPGPGFQAPCQNRRHLSPPRQGAHHAEAPRGKLLVR